jgi:hypothetical protein
MSELIKNYIEWTAFGIGTISLVFIIIEVFTDKADVVEQYIDDLEDDLNDFAKRYTKTSFFTISMILGVFATIISLSIPVINYSPILEDIYLKRWQLILLFGILGFSYLGIILYSFSNVINICNRITGGYAIGGIGAILGILGWLLDLIEKLI